MNEAVTVAEMAQTVSRLGLVNEITARELLTEFDDRTTPADSLIQLMERRGLLTPFQSGKLRKGDNEGYFLGGYRILYKIASGSFGRVYRGDEPNSGQIVAVKVLRRRWTEDPKRVESFEREGRIGMGMDHPNIVRILAVGKDDATSQHYIVMEFVEGYNLRDLLISRKTIELDEALHIMEECAAGLAYAWSKGLTHRDIKASNILLGTDKIAKLVDFGLAEISQGAQLIMAGVKPGDKDDDQADRTVDYAGLERNTMAQSGDIRSDIYFLGHVLCEMISGQPLMPLTKDKYARMQRRRFEEVETTFARMAQEYKLPVTVYKLISKAIAMEPSQRFQTPAQFHEAIKATQAEMAGRDLNADPFRASGQLTVYIVEANTKLQDVFREKFKKLGFRVLISIDATQAVKRFQTQPYHALIIDMGTAGHEARDAYRMVINEAKTMNLKMAAIIILNEDQENWADGLKLMGGHVFVRPVTMKQIATAMAETIPELRQPNQASAD